MGGLIGIMPWEVGLLIVILGVVLITIGVRQSKNKDIDLNNLPLIKPTTKLIFGSCFIFVGIFQIIPFIFQIV